MTTCQTLSFSDTEQTLIDSHTWISWQHLFFGQFSSKWANLQNQHINAKNLDKWHYPVPSGSPWSSSIFGKHSIPIPIPIPYGPYTTNYSMDPPSRRMMLPDVHALAAALIHQLCNCCSELEYSDIVMFNKSLENQLNQPLNTIKIWLSAI